MANVARKITTSHLINQASTSVMYPGTSTPAFKATDFFSKCGKTGATGTISMYGCPICCLAMFILYKGGLSNTSANIYEAVVEATKKGTNNDADFTGNGFTASVGGKSISVSISTITDIGTEVQNGSICMARMQKGNEFHYVIVDGWNESATDLNKHLAADPSGGVHTTLAAAMGTKYPGASYITQRFKFS